MDDRETDIILTSRLGWDSVVFEVHPPYREGSTPGMTVSLKFSHDGLEAVRQYMAISVKAAMIRDDIPERRQVEVPFPFGPGQMILCMSPNDVDNLSRHMREISAYARNLSVAGSWVKGA